MEPTSPMSPSPNLKRSTSFREFVTRVGPSYGDLVEKATNDVFPFASTILDCVLFFHNTLALTVYFLFVSESLERISFWPANSKHLGEPYAHVVTILWTALVGCWLSTWPTIGRLARLANSSPAVLWLMMFSIWMECPFGPFPIHREDIRPHVELREPLAAAFADDWVRRSPAVLCIVVFASFWHTNCVAVAREFHDATPTRLLALSFTSSSLLGLLYYLIAWGGYITWGERLLHAPNIVSLYSPENPAFICVRAGLAFSLSIAIPLNVFPIRESVQNMRPFDKMPKALRRILLGTDPRTRANREHEILGVILVLIPMTLSLCFSNVVQLITFLGGSLVSLLMIVFPCIVFRLVAPPDCRIWFWFVLLAGGAVAMFLVLASWGWIGDSA
ncbi:unnamed protein product [Durusdinium trenchii]